MKAIIDLKEEDIPERYKKDIDKCFDQIHYDKVRKTGENVLLFDIFPSDKNAERFEKYIKSGKVIILSDRDYYDNVGKKIPVIGVVNICAVFKPTKLSSFC